jgi:hypothetical protein
LRLPRILFEIPHDFPPSVFSSLYQTISKKELIYVCLSCYNVVYQHISPEGEIMIFSDIIINEDYPGINPVSFGCQDCTASHFYGPAVRTHWLLHYVVSGTGIFRRDGQEYALFPGDMFVIPPFLETYYEADAGQP